MNEYDLQMMRLALQEAKKAAAAGETPVGAVLCWEGEQEPVAKAGNLRETKKNALYHAELLTIHEACTRLGGWRLWKGTLYVTLEPCPMCAGAILNARLKRVVFGAYDRKGGAMGSVFSLFDHPWNHKPQIEGGVLAEESEALLKQFFSELRSKRKTSFWDK